MMRKKIKRSFDKLAYSNEGLNRLLRNLNKLARGLTSFRLRPYGVLTVRYEDVTFKMATNETSFVTKQLFWNGPENFEYTPIFNKLIRKCRTFVDIGANTGYYSLMAAKANRNAIVHAFEPASGPFHYLERNVQINKVTSRVFIHPIALSHEKGEVNFFEIQSPPGTFAKYNLSGVGGLKKTHTTQENSIRRSVPAEIFDEYSPLLRLNAVDLIKIDTEGTEDLVLEGAAEIIRKYKPIIICETLFNKIEDKIERIMKAHGYLFFNHLNGMLIRTDTIIREVDNGVSDCFLVHPDKLDLVAEFVGEI